MKMKISTDQIKNNIKNKNINNNEIKNTEYKYKLK